MNKLSINTENWVSVQRNLQSCRSSHFLIRVGMKKNLIKNGQAGRQDDLKIFTTSLVPKYLYAELSKFPGMKYKMF